MQENHCTEQFVHHNETARSVGLVGVTFLIPVFQWHSAGSSSSSSIEASGRSIVVPVVVVLLV